jgi:hypothetical protein
MVSLAVPIALSWSPRTASAPSSTSCITVSTDHSGSAHSRRNRRAA